MFAVLGAAAAGYSVLAMQSVTWAERLLRRLPLPQWLRPAIGGLLVTVIALAVPQVLGGGHGAIQDLLDHEPGLVFLLVLLVTKLVASAISLGSGFRGGMFSSSLLLGCVFGAAFGEVLALVVPDLAGQQPVLMLVGMASVAAAVIGSPLTMVFLVLEGTDNFPVTVGVMVGVVILLPLVLVWSGETEAARIPQRRESTLLPAHPVRSVVQCARQVSWLTARSRFARLPGNELPVTSLSPGGKKSRFRLRSTVAGAAAESGFVKSLHRIPFSSRWRANRCTTRCCVFRNGIVNILCGVVREKVSEVDGIGRGKPGCARIARGLVGLPGIGA
jgi:hypothetical protein